mgnify:CR=1 FL=1
MRQRHVAVLVETSTQWGRQVIAGIVDYVQQGHAWQLHVEPWGFDERMSVPKGWQGHGVIACVHTTELVRHLAQVNCPVVNVSGFDLPGITFPRVTTDFEAAARLASEYYYDRGFKHCAYFGVRSLRAVFKHAESFCREATARAMSCSVFSAELPGAASEWQSHREALSAWLARLPKPVGIFTWDAVGAREVFYAAQEAHLLVPEEVAILSGSEDELFCQSTPVPLSGLQSAAMQIGFQAAQRLDCAMHRRRQLASIVLPPLGIVERPSTDTLAVSDPAVLKAVRYIREHAHENYRVSDVVRQSGLSRRMLEIRFAEQLQRTIAQEIRRTHLERACDLLRNHALSMPEVAAQSGFSSPERLATVFHKTYGVTPLQYRKQAQGQVSLTTRAGE